MKNLWKTPPLTPLRIGLALGIAVVADGLQLVLGPLGWLLVDEIIDVIAMALTSVLLGFHWLLLPTFILEVIPFVDMLPTWTGCVGMLIALRKKALAKQVPPAIDVSSENSNL